MITRYIAIALTVVLAIAGAKIYFLTVENAELELAAERKEKEAALDLARKLGDQAEIHATVIATERRRRLAAEIESDQLLKRIREVTDAKDRLGQSVRIAVNELFDRARDKFGAVPADPNGSAGGRTVPGQEPVNEDMVRELAKAWAWCENGWQRVRDIDAVQRACRP